MLPGFPFPVCAWTHTLCPFLDQNCDNHKRSNFKNLIWWTHAPRYGPQILCEPNMGQDLFPQSLAHRGQLTLIETYHPWDIMYILPHFLSFRNFMVQCTFPLYNSWFITSGFFFITIFQGGVSMQYPFPLLSPTLKKNSPAMKYLPWCPWPPAHGQHTVQYLPLVPEALKSPHNGTCPTGSKYQRQNFSHFLPRRLGTYKSPLV